MGCRIKRILQLKTAISFSKITLYDDIKDITNECLYSWSTDNVCWTGWVKYDDYLNIGKNIESDFYLRILLFGNFKSIAINNILTNCYTLSLDCTNSFLQNFCENPNLFQPYNNLDCALLLQQQLCDSIICALGIPIYYIKIDPKIESADYTFKEYALHGVESIKQIKLMVPDGQMPSSNPKLTEFDFEWETDWETELSKTQFATAFGDTAFPKTGDVIYIPMMKRLWEVNAAYDEKNEGLMWRSTTWKLSLVKYNDSTNVDTEGFDDIFDNWADQTYNKVFGSLEKNEQEREVGAAPISAPKFAATNLFNIFMEDAVRKQYTKNDASVIDKVYNHKSITVARNIYKFRNENGCITYQKGICGEEGSLSFIIETGGTLNGELERDILNFGNIQIRIQYNTESQDFTIKWDNIKYKLEAFQSYMIICRWNRKTYNIEMNIYKYIHREDIPVYKLKPEMYWFDFENPVCSITSSYNNDYIMKKELPCQIHAYPLNITNIKYYNKYLDLENIIKESVKYTTQSPNCVINDLARPINSGHGYSIK